MYGAKVILAQIDGVRDLLGQPPRVGGGFDSTDSLIILGFVFLLAVFLFSWAYFIRKRPDERMGGRVLTRGPSSGRRHRRFYDNSEARSDSRRRGKVRRRRRRSEEPGRRNPTLGETGGLPPPRPEEPEDPPASGMSPSDAAPRS